MMPDGIYVYAVYEDDNLIPNGRFEVQNGLISIIDDGNGTLSTLIKPGPMNKAIRNVISSINRNHYAAIMKEDEFRALQDSMEDEHEPIKEGASEMSKLANLLEKEKESEEVDIPEHLVIYGSVPHTRWE